MTSPSAQMLKTLISVSWLAATLLQLAVLIRLIHLGVAVRYRWLFAWLATSTAISMFLGTYRTDPDSYHRNYTWCMILLGALECAVTWEAFAQRCAYYGGVRKFGRGLLAGLIAIGVFVSLFFLRAQFVVGDWPKISGSVTTIKYVVDALLGVFLLSTEVVFSLLWKPEMRRNVLVYCRAFTAQMLLSAAIYLVHNMTGDRLGSLLSALLQVLALCFAVALLVGFRQSGEVWEATPGSAEQVAIAKKRLQSAVDFIDDLKSSSKR